jgi:hypothetical protein
MSNEFDASLVWNEAVGTDVLIKHHNTVEGWMTKPSALTNAKLHATRELERLVASCNRIAWRAMPAELRRPSEAERQELLSRLSGEDRDRLLHDARLAAEQRVLVTEIEEAEKQSLEQCRAEQVELARREAERLELAEFEVYDLAGKAERFEAWRALRRNAG